MVRQSVKSLVTGVARGALGGFMTGLGIMFVGGAALSLMALGTASLGAIALSVTVGGLAGIFAAPPLTTLVVGACSAIGAAYKGVSDFVDMEETIQEKDHAIHLAREVNEIKKTVPQKAYRPHQQFVPQQLPEGVAKNEMPDKWQKTEDLRRAASASQETSRTV